MLAKDYLTVVLLSVPQTCGSSTKFVNNQISDRVRVFRTSLIKLFIY